MPEEPQADDKQYRVTLLGLKVEKDGEMFNEVGPVTWDNLRYEGVVLIQRVLLEAQMKLSDAGVANALAKGQGQIFNEVFGENEG